MSFTKINIKNLCEEAGLSYKKDSSNIEWGYFGVYPILEYNPEDASDVYTDNILYLSAVKICKDGVEFVKGKFVWNDVYNKRFLKDEIIRVTKEYKNKILELKMDNINKDFV